MGTSVLLNTAAAAAHAVSSTIEASSEAAKAKKKEKELNKKFENITNNQNIIAEKANASDDKLIKLLRRLNYY